MSNLAQTLNTNGVVLVEPVTLRDGHTLKDLQNAVHLLSQTLKNHKIAHGFLGSFVVVETAEDNDENSPDTILLSFFWSSQSAVDDAADNPLFQVLLDDVLSHCLSPEGERLRAPGLVSENFEAGQVSGLHKNDDAHIVNLPQTSRAFH